MNFDIKTMILRTKSLLKEIKPSPLCAGVFPVMFTILWAVALFLAIGHQNAVIGITALILWLISIFIHAGFDWYCLKIARAETPSLGSVFDGFRKHQFTVLLAGIIRVIMIAVMFILLYLPAVIAFYWLRPLNYIIMDNPNISAFKAIGESISLMKGHKLELFKLDIAFLGWHLLTLVTLQIAGIYTKPYTGVTYAEFYEHLKGQREMFAE